MDSDCFDAPECQLAGEVPSSFEICNNGIDDDGDGDIDCADSDCLGAPECGPAGAMPMPYEICDNGIDDDDDGKVDCDDPDCATECK